MESLSFYPDNNKVCKQLCAVQLFRTFVIIEGVLFENKQPKENPVKINGLQSSLLKVFLLMFQ